MRDRVKNPSINWPQSADEAYLALIRWVERQVLEHPREFGIDFGLGQVRSRQQADWLTNADSMLRARIADFLDELKAEIEHQ